MSQEAIQLLTDIRDSLRSIDASMRELVARKRAAAPPAVASDRDLDGKYGNPVLKFNPRDWNGAPFKGRRFSECPPDLLDLVAKTFDWFAEQAEQKNERANNGKPIADYKRQDAARARGWAKRIRDGGHVQMSPASAPESGWADEGEEVAAGEPASSWAGGF